jgi:hypothetical protein
MAKTNKLCPLGHQGRGKFAALSAMHIQNKGRRGGLMYPLVLDEDGKTMSYVGGT